MMGEYAGYNEGLRQAGVFVEGAPLESTQTATTVRLRDGKQLITEIPFAETRRRSAATTCWSARRWTTPSRMLVAVRAPAPARSRCARSCRCPRARDRCRERSRSGLQDRVRPRPWRWLTRVLGDFDLAEDAVQDAFATRGRAVAGRRRPGQPAGVDHDGRPKPRDRPAAARRALRETAGAARRAEADDAGTDDGEDDRAIPDERLRLIFTCCHPALALEAQVALTLRTLGGLTHAPRSPARSWSPSATWRSAWCAPSARSATAGIPYRGAAGRDLLPERLARRARACST